MEKVFVFLTPHLLQKAPVKSPTEMGNAAFPFTSRRSTGADLVDSLATGPGIHDFVSERSDEVFQPMSGHVTYSA
jgi:hypothetical protein